MLEVTGLCKTYKAHQVLSEVSLTAAPGDCVGIVGSNGCGKTTFFVHTGGGSPGGPGAASASMDGRQWGMGKCFMRRQPMCLRRIP